MASGALNAPNLWLLFQLHPRPVVALGWEIMEVPKSETQVSADLRDEADRIDDLAHALADYFRRKVVVIETDDKELIVEPRAERRLDD
jgi:hypothetical protein